MKDWSSWAIAKKSLKTLLDLDRHLAVVPPPIRKLRTLDVSTEIVKMTIGFDVVFSFLPHL